MPSDPASPPAAPATVAPPARLVVVAVVVVVVVELVRVHGGVDGGELAASWQLLDLAVLEDDPLRAVWHLHTQPPLFNLVIGLVAWSPLPLAGTVFVLYALMLLAVGLLVQHLLVRWGVPVVAATIAAGFAVANPSLLFTIRIASYEVPLAAMLLALVVAIDHHVRRPTGRSLAAVVAAGTALVLTRALFHPLWLLAILAVVLVTRRPPRRDVVLALAVPALLVGAVMVKNAALVGSPSLSSWTGFNLQRGVLGPLPATTVRAAVADGTVTSLATMRPWQPLDTYGPWLDGCRPASGHPALADPTKSVAGAEVPNFNASCYVGLYEESAANARAMIRRVPGQYAADRLLALALSHGYTNVGYAGGQRSLFGATLPTITWMDRLFDVVMVRTTFVIDQRAWNVPLLGDRFEFTLGWPLLGATLVVLGRGAWALVRWVRRRAGPLPATEVVWLVAGVTVAFVVIGGDLVELGENGRFRSMLDPLLFALLAVAVTDAIRRLTPVAVRERPASRGAGSARGSSGP